MRGRCLTERLTLQVLTPTPDSQGGRSTVPTTVATVWAELIHGTAETERLQVQNMGATTNYRFRIRTRNDVTPAMLAEWQLRGPAGAPTLTLEIHGIIRVDRRWMLLDCGIRS